VALAFLSAGAKGTGIGATVVPDAPADVAYGDIWICLVHSSSAARVISMDAAWTQIIQSASTTGRLAVFWHRVGVGLPDRTVTRNGTGTEQLLAGIAAFRGGISLASPVDQQSTAKTATSTSIGYNNLAQPSVDGCMLIAMDGASADNARSALPTSFAACFEDPAAGTQNNYQDATGTPHGSIACHYLLQATKAAVTGKTSTQAHADPYVSIMLALTPEPVGDAGMNRRRRLRGGLDG
jgi:hypothetical protein